MSLYLIFVQTLKWRFGSYEKKSPVHDLQLVQPPSWNNNHCHSSHKMLKSINRTTMRICPAEVNTFIMFISCDLLLTRLVSFYILIEEFVGKDSWLLCGRRNVSRIFVFASYKSYGVSVHEENHADLSNVTHCYLLHAFS